ncbi:MAG: hypothetical protein DRP71_09250 [Verrucomicrobia bacterium]|nr:MAG: hypothetical protein DRP71_09250 [Verrucomicrobiota bacterium]
MKEKVAENISALQQGIELLVEIDDATYRKKVEIAFDGTLGGHVRHNLDHYLIFLDGLEKGVIDYESRKRDHSIESDRQCAIERSQDICSRLASLAESGRDRELRVRMEGEDTNDRTRWAKSSVSRELEFLLSHTIHHYALASIMCRLSGVNPSRDFGVAPSTLRHRRNPSTCAQ